MAESRLIVVGIGASAGGLGALEELFRALRPDSGMAFVVIQHLDPTHRSRMAEIIRRHTNMEVVDAADQMSFEGDTVYIPPSDKYIAIEEDRVKLVDLADERIRLPIDFFFRSLAQSKGELAVGIVLSGTGADGTLGVREIRCAGGMVIAQDPKTAAFDLMPRMRSAREWWASFCRPRKCRTCSSALPRKRISLLRQKPPRATRSPIRSRRFSI